jgi:chromosome partitioning protein
MKILTAAVIKGGTAKTTTCAALAQAAAADGRKALAIDLDPQGNLSFALGADLNQPGAYDLLHGADPAQLIQTTAQGVDVIPAAPDLATERTTPGSAKRLQAALQPLQGRYDLIVIDTPPTAGELQYNALQAATGLLIPLEADTYSLQGLYQICDMAHQIQESNPALEILGTILTRYNNRPRISRFMAETIAQRGEEIGSPLLGTIRAGVAVVEAAALQVSLFDYAPKSNPAKDYAALYHRIMEGL